MEKYQILKWIHIHNCFITLISALNFHSIIDTIAVGLDPRLYYCNNFMMYLRYIIFYAWNMSKINILILCIFDTVINRVKYLIEKSKRQLFVKRTLQMVEEREEQRLDHRQPWYRSIHQNDLQVLRSGMLHELRRLRQGDSLPIAWRCGTTKEMDHLFEQK